MTLCPGLQASLSARDVANVLRKVLDGGPPSEDELNRPGNPGDPT